LHFRFRFCLPTQGERRQARLASVLEKDRCGNGARNKRYSRESEKILSLSGPTALTIVVIQGFYLLSLTLLP
jgi:hypothetical protein